MSTIIQTRPGKQSATTAGTQQAAASQPVRKQRTLRRQFLLQIWALLVLAGLLTLITSISLNRSTNDLNTINSGSIPSVDDAQGITQYIEIIDAQSADYLAAAGLTSTKPCTIAGLTTVSTTQLLTIHDCDEHNIDAEIVLVNQILFAAAHNVTYPGEQTAVERITIGLESYLGDIHQMRVDYGLASSKINPNDPSLQQAYQAYKNASAILYDQISLATLGSGQIPLSKEANLPSCTLPNNQTLTPDQWTQGSLTNALDCLSFINYSHLMAAYNDSASFLNIVTWLIALLCLLFCGLLLFTTTRMLMVSHRLINPGLLPALLIGLVLSISVVSLLGNLGAQSTQAIQDGAFKQMVMDDYNSVYYAALLKRYSTDANADESRWLIAQEFNDQANIQHWQNDWNSNVQQIESLIQKAQANQTWVEEIQPLADIHTYWNQYHAIDPQIRSDAVNLQDPNHLNTAEALSTGKSNQAFSKFVDAVGRLSQANRDHYTTTRNQASQSLTLNITLSLLLFPLAGLLAAWGIWIRLKDF